MSGRHLDLAAGRWHELSLAEQLGNIGSEISRAVRWQTRNPVVAQGALGRALDLFGLTLDDPRHRRDRARLREIARAREVVADFFAGPNQYGSTAATLQKYFDAYAVMARRATPSA
jgi:hypothetical protein